MTKELSRTVCAGMLSGELPSDEVADMVYRHSSIQEAQVITAKVNESLVIAGLKKNGWANALSFATSETRPKILSRLARDSRIQVRRAVANNPHCAKETQEYLFTWTVSHPDAEISRGLVSLMDVDWLCNKERLYEINDRSFAWDDLAERFALRGDTFLAACSFGVAGLDEALAVVLAKGPLFGVSLLDLIHSYATGTDDERRRRGARLTTRAWERCDHVSVEMAKARVEFDPLFRGALHYYSVPTGDEEAIKILLECGIINLVRLGAVMACTKEHFDILLGLGRPELWRGLLERVSELSEEQLTRFVELAFERAKEDGVVGVTGFGASVFQSESPKLSTAMMLNCIRTGNLTHTISWLKGEMSVAPTRTQVAELMGSLGESGTAFMFLGYYSNYRSGVDEVAVATMLVGSYDLILEQEWADEVAEGLKGALFSTASRDSAVGRYIARRLTQRFGDDAESWEMAISLINGFQGSISDLIAIVSRLRHANDERGETPTLF